MAEDIQNINTEGGTKTSGALQGDIAKILQDVKLPESRDFKASGDRPVAPPELAPVVTSDLIGSPQEQALKKDAPDLSAAAPQEKGGMIERSIVVPLRTLKDDMSAIVRTSKISFVRAASLEEEKRHSSISGENASVQAATSSHRVRYILGMLFAIAMLFGIGGAALFGVYTIMRLQQQPLPQSPNTSVLFAEHSVSLSVDNESPEQIKQIIAQARTASAGAVGSITRIVPVTVSTSSSGVATQNTVSLSDFLTALGAHAPDDLMRALSDSFFFGIHTVDKNAPIFVIPVVSYSRAFAGMLAWEASINRDLAPVFTPVPALILDENGLPVTRTFQDAVMNNYDMRQLKDDAGTIQLYYSFPTTQILVIAESPYSFVEILSRLQAGRRL